ncbi:hypothetical protein [Winogradskyella alexanderae]|uniref:Restriction endonuclease n=1 Tax=Winogradskyella alexanderae TaxID=2877123 RepID=A0ABS7XME6_9FLAO|nr:hypothetical protein [Winogradskyella alexanderae]MCA0131146.1 hypothetical protein [Winogradskyella alexanderae]
MKLTQYDTIYFINSKVLFNPQTIGSSILNASFKFAYNMAFGDGHHRKHRTGGTEQRSTLDIFKNTLQGKIAEGIAYEVLAKHGIKCQPIDYGIHGEGIWDDSDLEYKGKRISVKSSAYFSNLLLLETDDWDKDGSYKPNSNKSQSKSYYDYFILVRLKPNTNSLFDSEADKELLRAKILDHKWTYDIPGCCSLKTLRHIIANDYVLPKGALLNGKTKMDAENYYIQTGNLKGVDLLIDNLKLLD